MLKCYKNKTPNNNHLHYYFTDFDDYLTELGTPFAEYQLHDYRINENVIILGIAEEDANDITYFIDIRSNYKRCYAVDFMNYQNGQAIFNVSVDLWASYIADANISNIRVTRCNRNIGIGLYDKIAITKDTPTIAMLSPEDELPVIYANGVVCSILYTVVDAIPGTPSCTAIRTFYISLSKFQTAVATDIPNATLYDLIMYIGTIYKSDAPTGSGGTPESRIIGAYLISDKVIDSNYKVTDTGVIPTFTGVIRHQNIPLQINIQPDCEIIPHKFTYATSYSNDSPNYEIFVGTQNNGMKIARTTESNIQIDFDFIYQMSGMQVIVRQGGESYDLTKSFEIDITRNEGAESGQRKIANAIGVIGSFGALASGNLFMGTLGVASALNSALPVSNAGFNAGGDGASEFTEAYGCLLARKYISCDNEEKHARLFGANFNQQIDSLDDIESYSLLGSGSFTESYIKCDAFVDRIPELATNEILSKLNNGIYIKFLPHE